MKSINVPASSGTSLLITYGSFFSNPVGECTVQNAIYVDGAWVNDRWITVPSPLEPGGSVSPKNYGWASLSGTWVINDGAAHQIE